MRSFQGKGTWVFSVKGDGAMVCQRRARNMAWESRAKIDKDIETLELWKDAAKTNSSNHVPVHFHGIGYGSTGNTERTPEHDADETWQLHLLSTGLKASPRSILLLHISWILITCIHIHMFKLVVACCSSHLQLSAHVSSAIPSPFRKISVSHILGGAFLQAMEDVAPPEEFVDQESLRAVLGESHEDH